MRNTTAPSIMSLAIAPVPAHVPPPMLQQTPVPAPAPAPQPTPTPKPLVRIVTPLDDTYSYICSTSSDTSDTSMPLWFKPRTCQPTPPFSDASHVAHMSMANDLYYGVGPLYDDDGYARRKYVVWNRLGLVQVERWERVHGAGRREEVGMGKVRVKVRRRGEGLVCVRRRG